MNRFGVDLQAPAFDSRLAKYLLSTVEDNEIATIASLYGQTYLVMMRPSMVRESRRPFLNARNSWSIWRVSLPFWSKQSLFYLKNSVNMDS